MHNGLSHPFFSLFTSSPSTPSSSYEKEMQIEMPDWKYSTYQPIYQTGSLRFKDPRVMCYLTSAPQTFKPLLVKSRCFCRTQKITILFFFLNLQLAYHFKIWTREVHSVFYETNITFLFSISRNKPNFMIRMHFFSICMEPGDKFWQQEYHRVLKKTEEESSHWCWNLKKSFTYL